MYLVYGNYQHDVGDAEIAISREGMVSELGRMFAIRERWVVQGRLHASSVSAVNTAVTALLAAYSVDGLDIYLSGSSHIMRSADTINGTRVVMPPSFPQGNGAENSTFRTYTLAVEAEHAYAGPSVLLSWNEALSFQGTGGPVWGFLECLNGPPQLQMFQQQSVLHCKQVGTAASAPRSVYRNDYGVYWPPSPPIWPQWEHADRRSIVYDEPSDLFGRRVTHWAYEFSSNEPLRAYPHAASGVISHLGYSDMSTIKWRGDAAAVAQVDTLTVGGTIEADDLFLLTIGNKTLTVTAGSTVAATVADNIVAAWNALTQTQAPEFYEITAAATTGGAFTLTAKTAGKPFTVTQTTTEAGGGAADAQTFGLASTIANAGPNDISTAANYSGGALPGNGDTLVFENSSSAALYGLDALAAVTLAVLTVKQSYTGTIGLPRTNGSGTASYLEYRPAYMQVGATAWNVGVGDGSGSGRLKFNFGSVQFAGNVFNSGAAAENYVPVVLILGTHASNALTVLKGTVGVAIFAGEVSTLSTLKLGYVSNVQGDANVQLGDGLTLTTVTKAGGVLSLGSNVTTLTQYDGQTTVKNAATIGTGTVGGTIIDQSTGAWGGTAFTLLSNGTYDHAKSLAAKTITNFAGYKGAKYLDPYGVVTLTNGLIHSGCKPGDILIDVPIGKTVSLA